MGRKLSCCIELIFHLLLTAEKNHMHNLFWRDSNQFHSILYELWSLWTKCKGEKYNKKLHYYVILGDKLELVVEARDKALFAIIIDKNPRKNPA